MKRKLLYTLMFSSVVTLTACGGGGGGGGGGGYVQPDNANGTAYLRGQVPFATPVAAAVVSPFVNSSSQPILSDMYAADLSGNGGQNVVSAGVMYGPSGSWSNSKISVFSVGPTVNWLTKLHNGFRPETTLLQVLAQLNLLVLIIMAVRTCWSQPQATAWFLLPTLIYILTMVLRLANIPYLWQISIQPIQ